jgi:hypothetical protein
MSGRPPVGELREPALAGVAIDPSTCGRRHHPGRRCRAQPEAVRTAPGATRLGEEPEPIAHHPGRTPYPDRGGHPPAEARDWYALLRGGAIPNNPPYRGRREYAL